MRVALVVRRVEFVLATGLATPENARQLAVWWLILVSSPFVYTSFAKRLSLSLGHVLRFRVNAKRETDDDSKSDDDTVFESTTDLRQSFVAALIKKKGRVLVRKP